MTLNPLDWFKPVGELVESIGKAVDDNVTSDEERMILKNDLEAMMVSFKVKMAEIGAQVEAERTKRWDSDNTHGTIS